MKRRVPAFGAKLVDVDGELPVRINEGDIGRKSRSQSSQVNSNNAGGIAGQFFYCFQRAEQSLINEPQCQREGGLETDHAKGGVVKLHVFLYGAVGGMVGGDGINSTVGKTLLNRG